MEIIKTLEEISSAGVPGSRTIHLADLCLILCMSNDNLQSVADVPDWPWRRDARILDWLAEYELTEVLMEEPGSVRLTALRNALSSIGDELLAAAEARLGSTDGSA